MIIVNLDDNNELVTQMCGMNCGELGRLGGPFGCENANGCRNKTFDFIKHCPESCGLNGTITMK